MAGGVPSGRVLDEETERMMENLERRQDAVQLQALLSARTYLYTLFHKLFGGTPDEALLDTVLDSMTADVVDEYAEDSEAMKALLGFLDELRAQDRETLLDRAKDEYTRVFVGPGALPASPYESPYTGAHDMGVFQENTLAVRAWYRERGFQVRRLQAVPDDHVSTMCAFMARMGARSLECLMAGDDAALAAGLRDQASFVCGHLAGWVGVFAESVRNSKAGSAAVLYPQMLEALDIFVKLDAVFLDEAAFWAEGDGSDEGAAGAGAQRELAPELRGLAKAIESLEAIRPFGIQDNELVSIE